MYKDIQAYYDFYNVYKLFLDIKMVVDDFVEEYLVEVLVEL
jgi:hypothetical protein